MGIRKLLTSDEDSEEEQEQKQESEAEDEPTREGEERASKLTKKKKNNDEAKKGEARQYHSQVVKSHCVASYFTRSTYKPSPASYV